jgi:2,3-bisphosphoglycerate-independent phosphoglycerate mutase
MDLDLVKQLAIPSSSKIVMLVSDGLGGLPRESDGRSELEVASIPNLDGLSGRSLCGVIDMVGPGITPGSGPGHLALFGYDPYVYRIGRGVLEAFGIDLELRPGDVASRGNFCTLDADGRVVDRRAGRISTDTCRRLCQRLGQIQIEGVELIVKPVMEHRLAVVFRGVGLSGDLSDSDPLVTGQAPLQVMPQRPEAIRTAAVANQFLEGARKVLEQATPANMVLLRGFAMAPSLPPFPDVYRLRAVAITCYPMYRGLAKLVGMDVLPLSANLDDELRALSGVYDKYDFFYVHFKGTDRAGEDGDFDGKVAALEELDKRIPAILALRPDVLIVTGDHSTPAVLKGHSWHPVPVLLWSRWSHPDGMKRFTERECAGGSLGRMKAVELMPLAMANALRFKKFGA